MIKRFIYIVDYTLTQLNYERYGMDLLLKEGYEVEVVDAFDIQYSYKYRNFLLPQTSSKEIKITQVSTYSDINKILNSYSDGDCVILMYEVGCIFNRITKTLNRKKIPVVCISTGSLPSLNFAKKTTYIGKIIKAFKMYSVIFIFNLFLQKTLEKISFTLLRPRIQYFIYGGTFAFINSNKILKTIAMAYGKAPNFKKIYPILEDILENREKNLSKFIGYSLEKISDYLEMNTNFIFSSDIEKNNSLKAQDKILNICEKLNATEYINAIGGLELYDEKFFNAKGINLNFLETEVVNYDQFRGDFMPHLSIIDIMMFNSVKDIKTMLNKYKLI